MYAHTRRVLIGLGVGLALLALVVPTTARADLVGEVTRVSTSLTRLALARANARTSRQKTSS